MRRFSLEDAMRGGGPGRRPAAGLLREDFLEKRQCSTVIRLSQPEHGLLTDHGVLVIACHADEQWDSLIFGKLMQRKDGFLFDLGFGILIDRRGNGLRRAAPRFLSQPEKRLAAHSRTGILTCSLNERQYRVRLLAL